MYIYFTNPFDIGQKKKCRLTNHLIWGQKPTHADINSKRIKTENIRNQKEREKKKKKSFYFDHSSPAVGMQ